jgi:hypothetical protein
VAEIDPHVLYGNDRPSDGLVKSARGFRSNSVAQLGLMVPECAMQCERTPAIEDSANTTAIKEDGALASSEINDLQELLMGELVPPPQGSLSYPCELTKEWVGQRRVRQANDGTRDLLDAAGRKASQLARN